MRSWLIVGTWWMQAILDKPRRWHLRTDPACRLHQPPCAGSMLDRASRGLECEPCMVNRAFGGFFTDQENRAER